MAARHEEGRNRKYIFAYGLVDKMTLKQRRRGWNGHRVAGDSAGSWFQNRRFR